MLHYTVLVLCSRNGWVWDRGIRAEVMLLIVVHLAGPTRHTSPPAVALTVYCRTYAVNASRLANSGTGWHPLAPNPSDTPTFAGPIHGVVRGCVSAQMGDDQDEARYIRDVSFVTISGRLSGPLGEKISPKNFWPDSLSRADAS